MSEALYQLSEERQPEQEVLEETVVTISRKEKRDLALAVLSEVRDNVVDRNAYHTRSVVPMGGSGNTVRNGNRRGRYRV